MPALRRHAEGGGLDAATFDGRVGELPRAAMARGYFDLTASLVDELLPDSMAMRSKLRWLASLQSVGAALSVSDQGIALSSAIVTDPAGLTEADLPLAAGPESPPISRRPNALVSALREPAQLARFGLRLARAYDEDGELGSTLRQLETTLRIDLERDLINQFAGNGLAVDALGREDFAARAEVRNPNALARVLARVARRLPALARQLDLGRVRMERLDGERSLYRLSEGRRRGDSVVLGVARNLFVVGSTARRARRIASEPAAPLPGVEGAGVLFANGRALADLLGVDPSEAATVGNLSGAAEASTERLRMRVTLGAR